MRSQANGPIVSGEGLLELAGLEKLVALVAGVVGGRGVLAVDFQGQEGRKRVDEALVGDLELAHGSETMVEAVAVELIHSVQSKSPAIRVLEYFQRGNGRGCNRGAARRRRFGAEATTAVSIHYCNLFPRF